MILSYKKKLYLVGPKLSDYQKIQGGNESVRKDEVAAAVASLQCSTIIFSQDVSL